MALSEARRASRTGHIVPEKTLAAWFYIVRLRSGRLYVGSTRTLDGRWERHLSGRACQTTKVDPPVALLHSEEFEDYANARLRELQVKRWSRAKKEALIEGRPDILHRLAKRRVP